MGHRCIQSKIGAVVIPVCTPQISHQKRCHTFPAKQARFRPPKSPFVFSSLCRLFSLTRPNVAQNGKAQTTPSQPPTRPLAPRISQRPRPSCRHLLKSQFPHPFFSRFLPSASIHHSQPHPTTTSSINNCIASCRVINQTLRKHHFPSSQWPAPSRPPVSPPVARLPVSSSPPRLPASPRPPPEVSRSLTATSLVPSLCVRSVVTRRAPSC